MFLGIILVYLQIKKAKYYTALIEGRCQRWRQIDPEDHDIENVVLKHKLPTTTTIELSEKLLEESQ